MKKSGGKWEKILAEAGTVIVCFCLIIYIVLLRGSESQEETQTETVTVNLVYAYQNAQWNQGIQTIVDNFNKEHSDIVVNIDVQYENRVYEDILAKLEARGEMGDIIQLKTPERYAKAGLLSPLPQALGDKLDEYCSYDSQVYGLLAVGNTNGILYNKSIFDLYGLEEPQTYQEFLQLCSQLKSHGITPIGVAGSDLWHLEFWVNHFFRTDILNQNENWLEDKNQGLVSWQDTEAVTMLGHLQQLLSGDAVDPEWELKTDSNLAYSMSQADVAMIYTGSWTAQEVQKLNPNISLGWFFVPDDEGNVVVSENRDVYWCLTKECGEDEKTYQAACTFLEYFYSEPVYSNLCKSIYGFPVTVEKQSNTEEGISAQIEDKFVENSNHMSDYIGGDETPQGFEGAMLKEIVKMGQGQATVEDTAARLDQLWEEYQKQENE